MKTEDIFIVLMLIIVATFPFSMKMIVKIGVKVSDKILGE